jgi:hypothetical protein
VGKPWDVKQDRELCIRLGEPNAIKGERSLNWIAFRMGRTERGIEARIERLLRFRVGVTHAPHGEAYAMRWRAMKWLDEHTKRYQT